MKILDKFFKNVDKKEAISWAFFDFANSSHALLIMSFVFPIFFKEVIAGGKLGDFYWGLVVSISTLAGGIAAPIIGAIADYDTKRKTKFILFTVITIIGTAALYFTGSNMLLVASLIFIVANFFFEIAQTLYDSFLVSVSSKETSGRISGLGWGLGYVGGIIAMLLFKPFYSAGFAGALESTYKLTFPLTALFFLAFSIPSFIFLKEHRIRKAKDSLLRLVKIGFKNTFDTIKNLKKHKNIARFLVAFYFINDALVTLFAFIPIYARTTLSFSISEIAILLIIVQLIGFPSAVFFGWLSDKKGPKKIVLLTIVLWSLAVFMGSIVTAKVIFYFVAVLIGFVIGSSQAVARSWLTKIIPEEKRSEFFGFNGFASKVSAATGPVMFGAIASFTGNQRIAMMSLLIFFAISFIIFSKVKESDY